MSSANDSITLSIDGEIAIITLNLPKKLNALTQDLYYRLSSLLREIAKRNDIYITLLTGKGRYFSAYAHPPLPLNQYTYSPMLIPFQRRRRTNLPLPPHNNNRLPPRNPQILRRQQPRNNARILYPPKNPHHSAQWPRNRSFRRSNRLL